MYGGYGAYQAYRQGDWWGVGANLMGLGLSGLHIGSRIPGMWNASVHRYLRLPDDVAADAGAVYGYVPRPNTRFADFDFTDVGEVASNRGVREWYVGRTKIMEMAMKKMLAKGDAWEQIGRRLSQMRYDDILMARKMMAPSAAAKLGKALTPEEAFKRYGDWKLVAEKALNKNQSVNLMLGVDYE